jgi:hypothetical protein
MAVFDSTGGCLCGAVRYRFNGEPTTSSVCHCRSCRLASGATPIAYQHDDALHEIELTTATLDEPERFPPRYEIWHEDKLAWATANPQLPQHDRDLP